MEKIYLIVRDRDKKIFGITPYKKISKRYFSKYNLYDNFTLIKIENEFLINEYCFLYENKELIEYLDYIIPRELYDSLKEYLRSQIDDIFITKNTIDTIKENILIDKESINIFNKVSNYIDDILINKNSLLTKFINIDEQIKLYLNSDLYYNAIKSNNELDERYTYLLHND